MGKRDLALSAALKKMESQSGGGWNRKRIADNMKRDFANYGDTKPLGPTAIDKAYQGKDPLSARTIRVLRAFVKRYKPQFLSVPLTDTGLDLARFFNSSEEEMEQGGTAIEGNYQLYAQSNVIEDHLWLARVSFEFMRLPSPSRIVVELETERPAIKSRNAKYYHSDGLVAPRGAQSFFIIFRSTFEVADESGVVCIAERMNQHEGKIDRLLVHAVQYELERKSYMQSKWLLIRKNSPIRDMETTFIPIINFDDETILEELCLMETKRKLLKSREN